MLTWVDRGADALLQTGRIDSEHAEALKTEARAEARSRLGSGISPLPAFRAATAPDPCCTGLAHGEPVNSNVEGISVPLTKHSQPTSRAPVAGAVLGIVFIALAVLVAAPVALNWPASWPGLLIVIALNCIGVVLVVRHISRHRAGRINAEG